MNRFDTIRTIKINDKKSFKNIVYPIIKKESNDKYIIAKSFDRLDKLSNKYYQNVKLYWIIAKCNGIFGSLWPTPGTQICIPNESRLPQIINEFMKANGY